MIKETYKVKCPKRMVFGDPLYFEQERGERLRELVADITPPHFFAARVVLEETTVEGLPGDIGRLMTVYLARERTIETYLQQMYYENQKVTEKPIGVDSASYRIQIDGREETIYTGGDGCWGSLTEYFWQMGDRKDLDCCEVKIVMPDTVDMEEMRKYLYYFFEEVEQIKNMEMSVEPEPDDGPVIH